MASSSSSSAAHSAEATAFPDGTTEYKPLRVNKAFDAKKPHISDEPMTMKNWHKHVNWLNTTFILFVPLCGLISTYWVPLQFKTAIWALVYYFNTGLGITAGYHRLWAHSCYKASLPLKIYLAAVGAGAVEGSIRWWSNGHRAHHRYTDTDKDPYSVRKGLLYSHMGWMLLKQNPKKQGRTDITDLNEDPVVVWQHRNFIKSVITMALISSAVGKDATAIFNGGVYNHSNAAHNLLSTMRVGVLRGGCEVEIWKRAQYENKDVSTVVDSSGKRIVRAGMQVTKVQQPVASAHAA
ncbi:hypothetical protein RB599_006678 [Gaeumannomyces hyphopodioides]